MSSGLFGIDFGRARVGVAEADALGMLAHPRATLDVKGRDPAKVTADYLGAHGAQRVVVGLPRRLDGTDGPAAEAVRAFRNALAKRLPGVEILLLDERLTTAAAHKALREAGKNSKSSRKIIDQAAAVGILQSHLDSTTPAT